MDKPSSHEDTYFAKREFDRKKMLEEAAQKAMAAEERKRLKELHHMHCPKCGMSLIEIDYKHLKIDKCSGCDGVWLDAGELDQINTDETGTFSGFLKLFGK
ncbi:MAG: zf-TFIIB domain-containing protein [Nitrospinae bacterium]|nr:zf-TFIIB domain-containing protein [Nitrospinota bacterium]